MNGKLFTALYVFILGVVAGLGLPYLAGSRHVAHQHAPSVKVCSERLDRWLYGGTWVARDETSAYSGFEKVMGDCLKGGDGK